MECLEKGHLVRCGIVQRGVHRFAFWTLVKNDASVFLLSGPMLYYIGTLVHICNGYSNYTCDCMDCGLYGLSCSKNG